MPPDCESKNIETGREKDSKVKKSGENEQPCFACGRKSTAGTLCGACQLSMIFRR